MRSSNDVKVSFFLKKSKLRKNDEAGISIRITVNKVRKETRLKYSVSPEKWSQDKECVKGTNKTANLINAYLRGLESEVYQIAGELVRLEIGLDSKLINDILFGKIKMPKNKKELTQPKIERTILSVIDKHNLENEGILKPITMKRYRLTRKYLAECLKLKFNVDDLPLEDFTKEHVKAMENFLIAEKKTGGKGLHHNTMTRHQDCIQKIINEALGYGWIEKKSLSGY